jgi:ribonuclease-3
MTDQDDAAAAAATVRVALGHDFSNLRLLQLALTHRSHAAEHSLDESYERLEFLGDAVLQLAVTRYLFTEFPELNEGELAKVRAAVVDETTLAHLARELGLGPLVLLGRGEVLTGGFDKDSILSDVMESVIGAVYLEEGFTATSEMILEHWAPLVDERASAPGEADYKTRLQELLAQSGARPRYVISDEGPEHEKVFTAEVFAGDVSLGSGTGSSKKRAEQAAAAAAAAALEM